MKREVIESLLGRKVSDAEWLKTCELLDAIESHPDAEAVMDRCIDSGLSVDDTISELTKLPPPSS